MQALVVLVLLFNLTCNLDFLHNFVGLVLDINFDRNGITMVVNLLFIKEKKDT